MLAAVRWLKPQPLIDDAEKPVPMFDCHSVRGREEWERDPGLADIAHRLQMSVAETFNTRRSLTSFEGLLFILWSFSIPLLMAMLSRTGLPRWILSVAIGLAAGYFFQHLARRRLRDRHEHVINTLLGEGRCASCGYAIASLPADDRGLVTCPECGACWARTGVFAAPATSTVPPASPPPSRYKQFWNHPRTLLIDANGRYLRPADFAKAARDDERMRTLYRVAMDVTTGERLVKGLGGVAMAVGFGVWGLVVASKVNGTTISVVWNLIPPALLLLIAALSAWLAWTALRGQTRATDREMAHRLVRVDQCPSCLGALASDDRQKGCKACDSCKASWDASKAMWAD